ncbi:uncharacterized protein VTP21DRAFT_2882 [Calcarisporiella thermophila]|uniref:uncharacterized protein n=1 Tax=Calcarisporiella thermophila TaxID=911321 RepID=UPI00374363E2
MGAPTSSSLASKSLPPHSSLGDITPNNIGQLRKLNTVLFPVKYDEKFYKEVLEVGDFAKLAYYYDVCVGAICCRKELTHSPPRLYIMTIGVLAPYRNLGIGSALLSYVIERARAAHYSEIYLHLQVSNEEALSLYTRHGFEVRELVKNYYKRIEPADAHLLALKLE